MFPPPSRAWNGDRLIPNPQSRLDANAPHNLKLSRHGNIRTDPKQKRPAQNENGLHCRKPMKHMELAKGIEPPTG